MPRLKWTAIACGLAVMLILPASHPAAQADGLPSGPGTDRPGYGSKDKPWKDGIGDRSFAGTWYAFVDNTSFTLVVEQEGRILKAAHTAVYDYGRRVDSSGGGISIIGTIEGSTAAVEWKSGLSPETGKATIEYVPGRPPALHWRIDEQPKKDDDDSTTVEVAYFLPKSAYLMRKR